MTLKVIDQTRPDLITSLLDRQALFGDGFFTTGLIESGSVLHLERHLQRLQESAKRLSFPVLDLTQIDHEIKLATRNCQKAIFRLSIGRSQKERGYGISTSQQISSSLILSPWIRPPKTPCELIFADTPASVNPLFAGIKHTNRLDNVLAASECHSATQESLLCNEELVISGSRSNLFVYTEGGWTTPKLDMAGIAGLTRSRLLAEAKVNNLTILEANITKQQVVDCEAAFVTNSLWGMWPVSKIGNKPLATQLSHDLQSRLNFSR